MRCSKRRINITRIFFQVFLTFMEGIKKEKYLVFCPFSELCS